MEAIIFIAASTYKCEQIGRVFRKLSELGGGTLSAAFPFYAGDLGEIRKGRAANVQTARGAVEAGMGGKRRESVGWDG